MGYDRGDVLARTPLAGLCDELLGPHHGRGRTASWPCPDPGHGPQTGKTPPVTVFRPRSGIERWHCHACGAGGTAIDLVMLTHGLGFRDALEILGRRTGAPEEPWTPRVPDTRERPRPVRPASPDPALERYVSACEQWLWSPSGAPMRRWLAHRTLGEEILRANRVGADPGPRYLPRERGLPRGGPAVVLPLLNGEGRALYLQARYLRPDGRKYDNPSAELVPVSPRLGDVRRGGRAIRDDLVLVCEGLPDALTAAQAGYRSVAVLGAGLPDERLATDLVGRHPGRCLIVAFDADARGRAGSDRLTESLRHAGAADRVQRLAVPEAFGDLNGWAQGAATRFPDELRAAIDEAAPTPTRAAPSVIPNQEDDVTPPYVTGQAVPGPHPPVPAMHEPPSLDDLLDTLAYRHLLLDDGPAVTGNLEQVKRAVEAWRTEPEPAALKVDGPLGEALEQIRYQHLLVNDKEIARARLDHMADAVEGWADVAHQGTGTLPGTGATTTDALGFPPTLLPESPSALVDGLGW